MRGTTQSRVRRVARGWAVVLAGLLATGCSKTAVTAPDAALAPFVGDWKAVSMVATSKANPDIHPDLIALGATFTLNVQESGQYTAILLYASQAQTEIGHLEVSGNTVTLHRDFPSPSTSAAVYSFQGNHLILDGDTEFDFNLDGTPEPAFAHFDLVKQ